MSRTTTTHATRALGPSHPTWTTAAAVIVSATIWTSGCTHAATTTTDTGKAASTATVTTGTAGASRADSEAVSAAIDQVYASASPASSSLGSGASIGTPANESTPWQIQVISARRIPAPVSAAGRVGERVALRLAITSADGQTHTTRGQYPFNPARTIRDLYAGFAPLRLSDPSTGWYANPVRLRADAGRADFDETLATPVPTTISAHPFLADLTFPTPTPGTTPASTPGPLTLHIPGMPDITDLRPQP